MLFWNPKLAYLVVFAALLALTVGDAVGFTWD
jgi:hypothetical protein